MGVVRGAERAQQCQMLLKLGQSRTVSKGLLDLACISILGSHSHHLRDIEHARDAARLARERAAEQPVATSCTPRRRIAKDGRSRYRPGAHPSRSTGGLAQTGTLIGERRDRLAQVPVRRG
jgi:hypothetical protein